MSLHAHASACHRPPPSHPSPTSVFLLHPAHPFSVVRTHKNLANSGWGRLAVVVHLRCLRLHSGSELGGSPNKLCASRAPCVVMPHPRSCARPAPTWHCACHGCWRRGGRAWRSGRRLACPLPSHAACTAASRRSVRHGGGDGGERAWERACVGVGMGTIHRGQLCVCVVQEGRHDRHATQHHGFMRCVQCFFFLSASFLIKSYVCIHAGLPTTWA